MTSITRYVHVVRCTDPMNSSQFADVEVTDAFCVTWNNGQQDIFDCSAKNAVPTIIDHAFSGHGQDSGSAATRQTHIIRVTNPLDGSQWINIEVLDGFATTSTSGLQLIYQATARNATSYVLKINAEDFEISDLIGVEETIVNDLSAASRVVTVNEILPNNVVYPINIDGSTTPPNPPTPPSGVDGQGYMAVEDINDISFIATQGPIGDLTNDDQQTTAGVGSSIYEISQPHRTVIDTTRYVTDPNTGDLIPPPNTDPDPYVTFNAFGEDTGGLLTGNALISQGPLWRIINVSGSFPVIAITCGQSMMVSKDLGKTWRDLGLVLGGDTDIYVNVSYGNGVFAVAGDMWGTVRSNIQVVTFGITEYLYLPYPELIAVIDLGTSNLTAYKWPGTYNLWSCPAAAAYLVFTEQGSVLAFPPSNQPIGGATGYSVDVLDWTQLNNYNSGNKEVAGYNVIVSDTDIFGFAIGTFETALNVQSTYISGADVLPIDGGAVYGTVHLINQCSPYNLSSNTIAFERNVDNGQNYSQPYTYTLNAKPNKPPFHWAPLTGSTPGVVGPPGWTDGVTYTIAIIGVDLNPPAYCQIVVATNAGSNFYLVTGFNQSTSPAPNGAFSIAAGVPLKKVPF